MSEHITKDEYKILKKFMESPTFSMSDSDFDKNYPRNSEIRISAIHLMNELKMIGYNRITDSSGKTTGYKKMKSSLCHKVVMPIKFIKKTVKLRFILFSPKVY